MSGAAAIRVVRTKNAVLSPLMRLAHLALWLAWFAAWPAEGWAQALPLTLTWQAPHECPDGAAVERETRAMIARLPEDAAAHPLVARVEVHARGATFEAVIDTEQDGLAGQRTLRDRHCRALSRAVALVLALSLNADLVPEPPAEPVAVETAPVLAPLPAPPPPAPLPAPSRVPWQLALALDLGVATGLVPDVAALGQLRLALVRGPLSLELRGSAALPRTVDLRNTERGRATFQAAQAGLVGCYAFPLRVTVGGCAGGELAWARGESERVADPGANAGLFARALIEAFGALDLSRRLTLRLAVDGSYAFAPPVFALAYVGRVYRPETVGFRSTLGLVLRF